MLFSTHRIEDVAVALGIDEDKSGADHVREHGFDADDMLELCYLHPVLQQEIPDVTHL